MNRQDLVAVRDRCDLILAMSKGPMPPMVVLEVMNDIHESSNLEIFTIKKATSMVVYVQSHLDEIVGYRNNGMKIAEISNLVAALA